MTAQADYVWMDGKLVDWADAKVHVMTNALHYGTGVFEGIRAYPSGSELYVFRLREHMRRLSNSAMVYRLECNFTIDQLCSATLELLRKNKIHTTAYIRPILYASQLDVRLDILNGPTSIAICAFPMEKLFEKQGLRVCVSSWRRIDESSTPPLAKACGNYINSILAKIEASSNGFDDAILLDRNGNVSEGSGENIFIVKSGKLVTPPLTCSILPGITRDTVMTIAQDSGIKVEERVISRAELYTSDEVFFTGTAAEIEPILEVDGRAVSDGKAGPITKKLVDQYRKIVRGEEPRYKHWLTSVYSKA
jgi:branched-chain amino acid aminotransferase